MTTTTTCTRTRWVTTNIGAVAPPNPSFTQPTTRFRFAKTTRTPTSPGSTRQVYPPSGPSPDALEAGAPFFSVSGPSHLPDSLWISPYLTGVVSIGSNATCPPPAPPLLPLALSSVTGSRSLACEPPPSPQGVARALGDSRRGGWG
jgi:hypothetical protein